MATLRREGRAVKAKKTAKGVQSSTPKYDPNNKDQQWGIQQTLSGATKQKNRARAKAGYKPPAARAEAGTPARKRVKNKGKAKTA
jgi:hypothetical protein